MSVAIQADNVSKKYRLLHEDRDRYATLRDSLTNGIGKFLRKLVSPGPGSPHTRRPAEEDFLALNDVSFTIEQGERVGIIGRNGAGKTTLLKLLSRITEPTAGTIRVRGRVASLLEVGTGFHPELTGSENIYLNGAILGMSKAEIRRKYDEIVAFAEVERFLDTPVKRYSSGMYVRLAFAVAAHLQPEILLVDEVLAVGDAQFQKKCLGKMKEVGREGRTVLFVSHNLTAIRTLCDRAFLLRDGMLVADGSASEVVAQYSGDLKESVRVREWRDAATSPKNSSAALRRVSVLGEDGKPIGDILTDAGFLVEIEYEVLTEGSSVGWTVIFYDSENNCVFGSISNHEKNWYGKPMPRGIYKSTCKIPANLLNDTWFSLGLNMFGKGFTDSRSVNDVLRIEVMDGRRVRADYYGRYEGVVRPLLEWETFRMPDGR